MTIAELERRMDQYTRTAPSNIVSAGDALAPHCAGLRMYEPPILGCAAASDPLFEALNDTPAANLTLLPPHEWLADAGTVISLFFPLTPQVRESNRTERRAPSPEWMHARIEGQTFLTDACRHLQELLEAEGHRALVPGADNRFCMTAAFSSNWSERHVAYICGLGTFSLSKGLITRLGVAGRLGSVVTTLALPPTPREYNALDDYCTRCGACARKCPADAISLETGKDHGRCDAFLDAVRAENNPYYGCGKCQVGVPCESSNPS